jgi:hypothetical protein
MDTQTNDPTAAPRQAPISPDFLLALNAANTGYVIAELADTIAATSGMLGWDHAHALSEQIKRFAQAVVHELGQRIHEFSSAELAPSNIIIPGGGL